MARRKRDTSKPVPWGVWEKMPPKDVDPAEIRRIHPSYTDEEVEATAAWLSRATVYVNRLYQVYMQPADDGSFVHLSIKRRNRSVIRDWRHLQRIKNDLVGPECEGLELFPAESRLVDEANQFHLYVLTEPGKRIPVGTDGARMVSDESCEGAVQRPGAEYQQPERCPRCNQTMEMVSNDQA